ncbi:nuclear transport factor 2 family protein [Streptomyces niveus]|uniref:Nuclear transport factor 2 family protein n=1 Tax=Streptomyces niveus TaxID=193462 RepID=A0ABZ1ZUX5_STRNV|nr:nuclear transport factor 2 family protein [Streptomyces niveus]
MDRELAEFARRWEKAELGGDVHTLDRLLADDFRGVGPRGFVLDKEQWLERYASGDLIHDAFDWTEVEVRRHGESAVAIGVQSQQSIVDGRDADGRFRATQFLVKDEAGGGWRLVGIHLSALAEQLP